MKGRRQVKIEARELSSRFVSLEPGESLIGVMPGNDYERPRGWILYDPADDPEVNDASGGDPPD